MSLTYYFIESPTQSSDVLEWFRHLPNPPEEMSEKRGTILYFRSVGPLILNDEGKIDVARSPVVTIVLPRVEREILWTVGEVHFLSSLHLKENEGIRKIARAFSKWMKAHEKIHDPSDPAEGSFDYYLEGSAKNRGEIYGLRSGLERLRSGGYFVNDDDNEFVLDRVYKALQLRGV